jgi:outer membrane protein OmpA-like peptidoglycan-associated protein
MRNVMVAAAIVALGTSATGCATKKYVNTRVGEVNTKVTTLAEDLEKTQERTRANEQKITEVDAKAVAAGQRADAAGQRAEAAGKSASDAMNTAAGAEKKVTDIDRAQRRLVYEVVLQEDKARFANGNAKLAPAAKVELDGLVAKLTADPQNYYIEIEGHTDSTGPAALNEKLGLERAESVKRYLYEQHNVPLHKMNVISLGETKPAVPNTNRENRAANRRVVIRILA